MVCLHLVRLLFLSRASSGYNLPMRFAYVRQPCLTLPNGVAQGVELGLFLLFLGSFFNWSVVCAVCLRRCLSVCACECVSVLLFWRAIFLVFCAPCWAYGNELTDCLMGRVGCLARCCRSFCLFGLPLKITELQLRHLKKRFLHKGLKKLHNHLRIMFANQAWNYWGLCHGDNALKLMKT